MCGIVGVVDLDGLNRERTRVRLEAAVASLARRGPDGRGTWLDPYCGLGHTRLAVIDLSAAAGQPMEGHGGVIVYNGEIYNFRDLREDLAAFGHRFATGSDTEVLLAGWRQWGGELLPRLNGMFAFALWRPEARELVFARDRFGKKPLYYRHCGNGLAFASTLTALERAAGRTAEIDPVALRLYFTLRYVPEPWTIGAGMAKLPGGHLAVFADGRLAVERWYGLTPSRPAPFADEAEAAGEMRRRFDAAVEDRLVADVPVGTLLSGGIDSAAVTASIMTRRPRMQTFTMGFHDSSSTAPFYDETARARRVAEHLGTDHTEIVMKGSEVGDTLGEVVEALDEPFADPSALPTFLLARAVRQSVTAALSGDGGDELFAGYRKYAAEVLARWYRMLPRPLRAGAVEPLVRRLPERKGHPLLEPVRRLRRFVAHAGKPTAERHAGWMRLLSPAELEALFAERVPVPALPELLDRYRVVGPPDDSVNAMLGADLGLGLQGQMLVKVDRMSMASSLEVRCPFLDHRVAECAAAIPGRFKVAGGKGKRILRRAFADRLPAEVFAGPKKGFDPPLEAWLTQDMAGLLADCLDPARLRRQGLFDPAVPARWRDDLVNGRRDTAGRLWAFLIFQLWLERRGVA